MLENIQIKLNRDLLGFREPTIGELDFIHRHIDKFSILDTANCIRTILYIILTILLIRNLPESNMLLILFVTAISYFAVIKVEPFATDTFSTYYISERGEFIKYDMNISRICYGEMYGLVVKIDDKYVTVWS